MSEKAMPLAGRSILLAEDNPTNQIVAVQMLETLGAEVTLATDGEEALEIAGGAVFDIALIDIEMPKLSGLDVIRRLRASGTPNGTIPLIALTAYVMVEHREAIDAAGANGVIAKPILSIERLAEDILELSRVSEGEAAPRPSAEEPEETPAAAAEAVDLEVFSALEASLGADAMGPLLAKVLSDLAGLRGDLAAALADRDRMGVRRAAHTLVSIAGAIGATRLQDAAQCLNFAAHDMEKEGWDATGNDVLWLTDAAIVFVQGRARLSG